MRKDRNVILVKLDMEREICDEIALKIVDFLTSIGVAGEIAVNPIEEGVPTSLDIMGVPDLNDPRSMMAHLMAVETSFNPCSNGCNAKGFICHMTGKGQTKFQSLF